MVVYAILGVTILYIVVVVYLYLTSEMPDTPDWDELGWK